MIEGGEGLHCWIAKLLNGYLLNGYMAVLLNCSTTKLFCLRDHTSNNQLFNHIAIQQLSSAAMQLQKAA